MSGATGFMSRPALGVSARIDGVEVRVGGPGLLTETGVTDPFTGSGDRDAGLTRLFVIRGARWSGR